MLIPQERNTLDSALVEKRGPSMVIKVLPRWAVQSKDSTACRSAAKVWAERLGAADMSHQAEEGALPVAGEIEQAVGDDDMARCVIFVQRTAGADADDPPPQGLLRRKYWPGN